MPRLDVALQRSLFDAPAVSFDAEFRGLRRAELDRGAWYELQPGWVAGADILFDEILAARRWGQRTRMMYDNRVKEPRLTAPWNLRSGAPLEPAIIDAMRVALSGRYGVIFDSVGFNLYRDGRDSVAWHRDHILPEIVDPTIALVSVGERRKLLLRPHGGGRSIAFMLGAGDLLVLGGTANRTWEHSVPKVAQAGPRLSLAFRHGMDPHAYAQKRTIPVSTDDE